jgi:cell wall-associated NlpC family hydrolase
MTWDATAIKVGIKSIGAVESSMNYGAVNSSDPITVGLFQWFGTRASAILRRMQTENGAIMPTSIEASLSAHSDTDSYWTTRYLTASEINALKPILVANQPIQDNQAASDLNDYKQTGVNLGINADINTHTLLFFCNMYNQSPREALRVLSFAGPTASLDRIYAECLNNSVLGKYRTRYQQAYTIIKNDDYSGVGDTTGSGGTSTDPGGDPSTSRPTTDITNVRTIGDHLLIRFKDGHALTCYSNGAGAWIPAADSTLGADVPPDTSGTTPPTAITDIINWLAAHDNAFDYSQGAGRLDPITNGYTDCSGLMYYAFKNFANMAIGTWTGDQSKNGTLITTSASVAEDGSTVQPGDLVFYRWHSSSPSTFDHVAMYIGSNQIQSHGGPDPGPDIQSHSGAIDSAIAGGGSIMVRRYVS